MTFCALKTIPEPGYQADYKGQVYVAAGSESYVSKKGNTVPLVVWSSHCATCGRPFQFRSTLRATYPSRRCGEHHKPGARSASIFD